MYVVYVCDICACVWVHVPMRVQGLEEESRYTGLPSETLSLTEPGAGLVISKPLCPTILLPASGLQHAWLFMWVLGI